MSYEEIKNKILEALNSEDVIYDGVTISAYDLVNIINKEFGNIKYMINNKKKYLEMFKLPKSRMFKKYLKNTGASLSYIDMGYERLMFVFNKEHYEDYGYLSISKDENGNLIDTNTGYDGDVLRPLFKLEFIELNEEMIRSIISVMENLREKYDLCINYGDNILNFPRDWFISSDKFFGVYEVKNNEYEHQYQILLWNGNDETEYLEGLNEDYDSYEQGNLIENNYELLLHKIPIEVSSLKPLYQKAIELHYNNEKVKVLKK